MGASPPIPRELQDLIFDRLGRNPVDNVSIGAVSKEWRDVVIDKKRHIIPRVMLMMVEDGEDEHNTHALYSLSPSVNNWEVSLPEYRGKKCVGSNNGWLIIVDAASCQICLLNPLTTHRILLPTLERKSVNGLLNKRRAIFTLKFDSPSNYLVAICFDGSLLYCKAGDTKWVVSDETLCCPDSVLYYKEKLYLSLWGCVFVLNLTLHPYSVTLPGADIGTSYLVESQEKGLLLVVREEVFRNNGFHHDVVGFRVFMLDGHTCPNPQWVKVDDLGEEVLFLGLNAICLSAHCVPECSANSIYFIDYIDENTQCNMGVFHMKDQSVKPLYQDCPFTPAPSVWFTPNLQSNKRPRVSV